MKVLVTGHQGYIGTVMVPMLTARGHEVVGLDCDLYRACTFGRLPSQAPALEVDVRDVRAEHLKGFDAVVHLAGLSNDPLGELNPSLTYHINHVASVELARLAKQAGVRKFLFSSSCSVYGASGEDWINESSPARPVTAYAESKVRVEDELREMADSGFSPVMFRNATAYGFSPRIRFDLVVNNLTAWAHCTGRVLLKSDGTAWRPLVHIADISRAFAAGLEAPLETIHNEIFNVGATTENYRVRDVAEIVRRIVPASQVDFVAGATADKRCYRVDCEKIRRKLGFEPAWTVESGVLELYESYRRIGLNLNEFEGARYKRVDHIQLLRQTGRLSDDFRWKYDPESEALRSRQERMAV